MSELCSLCQVAEDGPYCPVRGAVRRPFSIGARYEVDALIAAGETSFVFAAQDRPNRHPVAVKVLRSQAAGRQATATGEAERRFLRAATALRALGHEHLARIVDLGRDDALGAAYLVMERLSGQTVEDRVRQRGPLPWRQAVPLVMQIARAIAAAHEHGISDGDLTAGDVFVTDGDGGPTATLCGFGLAGAVATDPRDDIRGLGAIAHELLTGRPPPEGGRASDALSDDPPGINEQDPELALPHQLDELIRACRLRHPMLRPTLDEIEATLRSLAAAPPMSEALTLPAARTDPLAMPAMIGSYRVVSELGSGGTGRVYLGQHPVIGSQVAIKVLLPDIARSAETVERFIQEARASSQIGSPHLPRYFDFGTTPAGLPYAIMEYFPGETLGARLTRVGTMSVADTAQIVEQVATALGMAHDAGLIHRDLKPDNLLLVEPDGKATRTAASTTALGAGPPAPALSVKVLDFGIAKVIGGRSASRTLNGAFLGTPFYCAPEQVFGHEVDARTDVYCLGATAFHMLTGAPPFVGEVPYILSSKATEDPPDPEAAGMPPAVAHTIRRMLARDRADRPPSMAWVLEEVRRWPHPSEIDAAPVRPSETDADAGASGRAGAARSRADAGRAPAPPRPTIATPAATPAATPVPPPGRARRRAALIAGGVLAMVALAVVIGASLLRSTAPTPARRDARGAADRSMTQAATPPTAPPATEAAAHGAPAPAVTGDSAATQPPPDARADGPLPEPISGPAPHRPRARPPDPRPAARKPKPGEAKDVLIVDPFSHDN